MKGLFRKILWIILINWYIFFIKVNLLNALLKLAYQVPLTLTANTHVSGTQCFSIWKTNDTIYELYYTQLLQLLYGKTRYWRNSHAFLIFEWVCFPGFPGGEKGWALSEGPWTANESYGYKKKLELVGTD